MKKILLITTSLLMMGISLANYTVVIGNGMPKESIKFVDRTTPTPTPEPEVPPIIPDPKPEPEPEPEPPKQVCNFSYPTTFWEGGRNSSNPTGTVVSNRVYIYSGNNYNLMEIIVGNIKYTRGKSVLIASDIVRYEVCSISI
jgi:hypothetical protein